MPKTTSKKTNPANLPDENKKKILVVDDHPIVRQGLAQLISAEEDLELVGEASNTEDAMKAIAKLKPDLIIVDISLKGTSGLDLTKNVLLADPGMKILIVSSHEDSFYVDRALKSGAKGYLAKQEATDQIVTAIHKVLGGEIYVSEKMRDSIVSRFISGKGDEEKTSLYNLSDRELEVLRLIGQGLTTRQIAEKLFISAKTIDSHYANIKNKLNLSNSHELIQYSVKWVLRENA